MHYDFTLLLEPKQPWVLKAESMLVPAFTQWLQAQANIRVTTLDGNSMLTGQDFYDEVSKGLGFPEYFGENLNALGECLTDEDIMGGSGSILFIQNGSRLLGHANLEALEGVLDTFRTAGAEWSVPVDEGKEWDRPALPFHVVIEVDGTEPEGLKALPTW